MAKRSLSIPVRPTLPLALWLVASILGLGVYVGALNNPLLHTDRQLTVYNPQVNGQGSLVTIWSRATPPQSRESGVYRPVLALLLRMEYGLWRDSPSSYHAVNLLLLLGNVLAFLLLVARLTSHGGGRAGAVLIFTLHPLASQSVLGVDGQGALLAMLAGLTACLTLVQWRQGARRLLSAAVTIASCQVVAAGAHEMGLVLPAWLALLAVLTPATEMRPGPRKAMRPRSERKNGPEPEVESGTRLSAGLTAMLAIGLPVLAMAALILGLRLAALGSLTPTGPAATGGWDGIEGTPARMGPAVMLMAFERLAWPAEPTRVYAPAEEKGLLPPVALGWLALGLAVAGLAAGWRWRNSENSSGARTAAIGAGFLLGALGCQSHWIPLSTFFSEGPLLFALPGMGLMAGAAVELLAAREPVFPIVGWRSRALAMVVLGIAVAMAWTTRQRSMEWSNEVALWQHEAERHPRVTWPLVEVLAAQVRAGNTEEALRTAERARERAGPADLDRIAEQEARIYAETKDADKLRELLEGELAATHPAQPGHLNLMAEIADRMNLRELAEELYAKETKQNPKSFQANFQLAKIEYARHNNQLALRYATTAVETAPADIRALALAQLGEVLMELRAYDRAIEQFVTALVQDPALYLPYVRLTQILWGRKDYAQAEQILARGFANARVASYVDLATMYVRILEEQKRTREAQDWLIQCLRQFPTDIPVRLFAAETLIRHGDFERARLIYEALSNLTPEQGAEAMIGLGKIAHERDHDRELALKYWRQALKASPGNRTALALLRLVGAPVEPGAATPAPTPAAGPTGTPPAQP